MSIFELLDPDDFLNCFLTFFQVFCETASEVAEVYFYYGKARLEMARLEKGVLGNALDGGGFGLVLHGVLGMGCFDVT